MKSTDLAELLRDDERVEELLRACVARAQPALLRRGLADALGGGSRTRPRFCLAIARAASTGRTLPQLAHASAAAVELMHCASLVHDDLPCFDDAPTRRGKPSLHRIHGEPAAVLAGDALIVEAFHELAAAGGSTESIMVLARAAGGRGGLVSGQAMELDNGVVDIPSYHAAKTGSLFEAAAVLGAAAAGADPEAFVPLGRSVGAFYQVADDVADVFGDPLGLGKPIHRDAALERPSAARGASREEAERRLAAAAAAVRSAVPAALPALADFLDAILARMLERALPGVSLLA